MLKLLGSLLGADYVWFILYVYSMHAPNAHICPAQYLQEKHSIWPRPALEKTHVFCEGLDSLFFAKSPLQEIVIFPKTTKPAVRHSVKLIKAQGYLRVN